VPSQPDTADWREEGVVLEGVTKTFGDTVAVDTVTLRVGEGELLSLLGPSGCGKTTLLRVVAGFETPDSGAVIVHGRDVTSSPPQKRPTAMVFQSYALFPTMTVGANVEYGLRVRRVARAIRTARVREALGRVGLEELVDRPVTMLSGGQQQRVAVARALAVEPEVLLFDEPLSNLDVELRERTREELRALQQRLGITSIYVTHDQEEALALSDHLGVMDRGKLVEFGTPRSLYENPKTAFVARFLGGSNVISDARIAEILSGESPREGKILAVRPEHLKPSDGDGGLPVRVVSRQYLGAFVEYRVEAEGNASRMRVGTARDEIAPSSVRATRWTWVAD
jgi:ABC-type Fe3+/spermidine/putrescine transport system ATPase subunit